MSDSNQKNTNSDLKSRDLQDAANFSGFMARDTVLPEKMKQIPAGWNRPCKQAGTLKWFYYLTCESSTFFQQKQQLHKKAVVYIPYGYDPAQAYPVVYLMHGGWSDETKYFGSPEFPDPFKNVIDHATASGKMTPMLIVCPTYNNLSPRDSSDYDLALRLTARYPQELIHSLIPAFESTYHTYAASVDLAGIDASRDHRAFGGFSMGSVQTWHVFEQCLHAFRYFFPSSGNFTSDADEMAAIVERSGKRPEDFFIFSASGTHDFAGRAIQQQIYNMVNHRSDIFRYASNEKDGNVWFIMEPGQNHDLNAARLYIFNAFLWLWK